MSVFTTVLIVIIAVCAVSVILYILFKWIFRQLVFRPFLQNELHQPPLFNPQLWKSLSAWPPKFPSPIFAAAPEETAEKAAWSRQWRIYAGCQVGFWLFFMMFGIGNSITITSSSGTPNFFVLLAYVTLGIIIIVPFALGLTDTLTGIAFVAARYFNKPLPNTRKNWELERWGVAMSFLFVFTLVALSTGYSWGRDSAPLKTIEVPLARLPQCLDKLRVFLITDVHTGPAVSKRFVEETTKVANGLDLDLVLHVGDGGDGEPRNIGAFNKPWGGLTCPNRYFVTGNHEYLHGNDGPKPWEDFYRDEVGFTVLHNAAVKVGATEFPSRSCGVSDSLTLVGIPDAQQEDSSLPDALKAVNTVGDEWLLLSHQPMVFPEAVSKSVGLQVSGHMHAGQCFPMHPIIYLTSQGLFSGLIQREKSFLYVSSGNANWGSRVRLFSRPENTLLILRNAQNFAAEGKTADVAMTSETVWAITGLIIAPLWLLGSLAVYVIEAYNPGMAWWKAENATFPELRGSVEMVSKEGHQVLPSSEKANV